MSRVKHSPQRTCVACRQATAKRQLIRVVRTATGSVVVDPTGKLAGRGAYLCAAAECWERAVMRNQLAPALRTTLSAEDKAALADYGRQQPAEAVTTPVGSS